MKSSSLFLLLFVITFLTCSSSLSAQLFVDNSFSAEEMVMDFFHDPDSCVSISNVSYTGAPESMGFFEGSISNVGLDTGIILCSGDISTAIGPNDDSIAGYHLGQGGDSDLNALLEPGDHTNDAAY